MYKITIASILINSDSYDNYLNVSSKRFANRSLENSEAWFSYDSFKIRDFWEYHSSGGICGWNEWLHALSGCEIDFFFLCLDMNEINDFINVKMRNRYGLSGCEWNSYHWHDVKHTSCDVIEWNKRWNGSVRMRNGHGILRCW